MGLKNSKIGSSPIKTSQEIQEELPLVWLTSDNLTDSSEIQINNLLTGIFSRVYIFDDVDRCINYVTDPSQNMMILVIARPFSDLPFLINILLDFKKIAAIYIYSNTGSHQKTSDVSEHRRFKGIFTDITTLITDLKERVQILRWFQPVNFTTTSSNKNVTDDDAESGMKIAFVFGSLIKDIFLDAPVYAHETDGFIDYCRIRFANDKVRLNVVKQFKKTYRSDQAILWYTKSTFIFQMLNQAIREQDFNVLFILRFFIRDLTQHLSKINEENVKKQDTIALTLYRGQGMAKADFDRQIRKKVGGLLFVHEFLSTSREPEVAEMFTAQDQTNISVLFEIQWMKSCGKHCFADIKAYSQIPDEEECLFQMGSTFRIDNIKFIGNNQWKVYLSISSRTIDQIENDTFLYSSMKDDIFNEPTVLHRLAKMLFMMGQYTKAKQMYTTLIETTNISDRLEMAYLNFKLGRVLDEEGLPEQAYKHFCQSLNYLSLDAKGKRQAPFIYLQLAHTLQQLDRLTEARDNIEKGLTSAITIRDDTNIWTLSKIIYDAAERCDTYMAFVLSREGEFEQALEKHLSCLIMRLSRYATLDKWKYAESYSNIASSYLDMLNYTRALEYYQKALLMQRKYLIPNHPAKATTYFKIACVLQSLGQLSSATYHARLAYKQLERTSTDHSRIKQYKTKYDELFRELLAERIQTSRINSIQTQTGV